MSSMSSMHSPELRLMKGALAKTTDENLTSENWELILNLCDKVQDEGEQGSGSRLRRESDSDDTMTGRAMSWLQSSSDWHTAIPMCSCIR